jgi:oxalate decarboxylase/phosphoglucose isomerase-like protein (cupin superfamily)
VIVWLGAGTLRVNRGDGAAAVSDVKAGTMRYIPRGSNETVEVVSGSPRAMFFELK